MRLQRITSRNNQRLLDARKVRDGKLRDLIHIEGKRLAAEAFKSNIEIVGAFLVEDFDHPELLNQIDDLAIDVIELQETLFRSIAATEEPQGIILLAKRPAKSFDLAHWANAKVPVFLFLKEINNPSNLGAILRSVEAAGAGGVFISPNSADPFSSKALRASMGSAFRVAVELNADLSTVIDSAKDFGVSCVAVDPKAERSYADIDWKKPYILVYGSEAHGLGSTELEQLEKAISIPIEPAVESLNLAAAVAIVLFEAKRQSGDQRSLV